MTETLTLAEPTTQASVDRSRWAALLVLCGGMLMIVLDGTVVNVALPTIRADLGFSDSSLAWVMNAYLIAFGGLLLLAGRLGDLRSPRGVFLIGLVVFTVASTLCGVAPNATLLVAARFVQGVGGAMTSAVILGMIVTIFPEARERAKAIGIYAFVCSAGGSVGLLAGGVITQLASWRWLFFINIPVGIVTLIAARRLLAAGGGNGAGRRSDVPGAILITAALMLGVYTIVQPGAEDGWTAPSTLIFAAATVAALIAFVVREARIADPLVPLRIFRSRTVSGANIVQALSVAGMFGMMYLGTLYLQTVLGYDALQTGLGFLPTTLVMATISMRYSETLITQVGPRTALLTGLVLLAGGLALFARASVHGSYLTDVLPASLLIGAGIGTAFPSLASMAMSDAKPEDAGLASGLVNTSMQLGAAVGLAVLATLSATRTEHLRAAHHPTLEALAGGYRLGFWVGAALIVVAIVVAAVVLPRRSADQTSR